MPNRIVGVCHTFFLFFLFVGIYFYSFPFHLNRFSLLYLIKKYSLEVKNTLIMGCLLNRRYRLFSLPTQKP